MRVTANTEICSGAGQCVLSAPGVFGQDDDDGTVVVLEAEPDDSQVAAVRAAVDVCPTRALAVR